MSEGFLSRWSRRKQDARSKPADDRTEERAPPPEPVLAPDEIAALPRIDELTADSDITGFLRRGVPEALRNAALRRAWMLDPAIRDFVGPARDYDYDWNTPGGAPGHGALEPGDDVAAMVRRILGEPEPAAADTAPDRVARAGANKAALPAPQAPASEETATGETPCSLNPDARSGACEPDERPHPRR